MSKNWMFLWKLDQIEVALKAGKLIHAASGQFSRVSIGDRIWIVGTRKDRTKKHHLFTIGYVKVDNIFDQAEATDILGYEPWFAKFHVIAHRHDGAAPREIQLDKMVSRVRFVSPKDRLTVSNGTINPQELQTLRELTVESARILEDVWAPNAPLTSSDKRSRERLPAEELRKVKAGDLWSARQQLLQSRDYSPFADSDEYDVLFDDDQRLPPKALFGKALSKSLGFKILPWHFAAGQTSTCFRILRERGYLIVKKGTTSTELVGPMKEKEWQEGDRKLRNHLRSERQTGLPEAKREHFIAKHGKLYCEHCGLIPIKSYESAYSESCIEVHHARVAVAVMEPGHWTTLEDLQCLCANCHRIEHARLRHESD